MDDHLYEVRITALQPGSLPPEQVQAAFAELFCLTPAEARQRLSALPLRVRGELSLAQAEKYQRVLSRAGMVCEVRPQVASPGRVPPCSPPAVDAAPLEGQA